MYTIWTVISYKITVVDEWSILLTSRHHMSKITARNLVSITVGNNLPIKIKKFPTLGTMPLLDEYNFIWFLKNHHPLWRARRVKRWRQHFLQWETKRLKSSKVTVLKKTRLEQKPSRRTRRYHCQQWTRMELTAETWWVIFLKLINRNLNDKVVFIFIVTLETNYRIWSSRWIYLNEKQVSNRTQILKNVYLYRYCLHFCD